MDVASTRGARRLRA